MSEPLPERIARLWRACAAHANEPVPQDWLPLACDGRRFGWVAPDTGRQLVQAPSPFAMHDGCVALTPADGGPQPALHFAARRLHESGIVREWRNEQLDVLVQGAVIGTIERAACRALGIETRSIQLNGLRPDGTLLTAQRAAHKTTDPNRWDNLAGGMISAAEDDLTALAREAYEEAGLVVDGLALTRGARLLVQRMVNEGLMVETVQIFDVQLPERYTPVNHDGEVAAFEARPVAQLLDLIERGEFTLQSSLAMLDALRRRP